MDDAQWLAEIRREMEAPGPPGVPRARRIEPMPGRRPQIPTSEPLWPPELIRAAQRPKVPMPPLHAPGDEPKGIVAPIVAGLVLAIPVALAAGGELWDIVQGWRCRRDVARACRSMR